MFRRIIIATAVMLLMILASAACCSAECTSIYVGSKVSEDGSTILTRSNDHQSVWGNMIITAPRVENKPGRTMPVDSQGKTQAKLPDTTYKYQATPFMDSADTGDAPDVKDAAVCINEYGVAMTMSVTAFSNKKAKEADPLIETGLVENAASDLVICQSKTARQAVKTLLGIIDEYGSAEINIALIADRKEAWYVEMYTGHQYAAVKLPQDKVSVFGNEFNLEYLSDYEDSITSKDLLSLPKKKGFAVYGKNKELNLWGTYSGKSLVSPYSHMRTWIGHQILAPSGFKGDYRAEDRYPLCFKPDRKVSMTDVCTLMRNRYEGTKYDPDKTGRKDMRVIGSDTALSVHAVQIFPKLAADMSCVLWESSGPAIYGVFIPVSNDITSVDSAYGKNQPEKDAGVFDSEHYPYYTFKGLTTLCVGPVNYKTYGVPVKKYWAKAEKGMFEVMPKVLEKAAELKDKNDAAKYLTAYCNAMQKKAFSDGKALYNDVQWAQSENSNTFKKGKNPETNQVLDEYVKDPPMEVDLDASAYSKVPDPEKLLKDSGNSDDGVQIPVIVCLIILIAAAAFVAKKTL